MKFFAILLLLAGLAITTAALMEIAPSYASASEPASTAIEVRSSVAQDEIDARNKADDDQTTGALIHLGLGALLLTAGVVLWPPKSR